MISTRRFRMGLLLTCACISAIVPKVAIAKDGGEGTGRLIRAGAIRTASPIGKVMAIGGVTINRRLFFGEQLIWNGDVLQSPADASACVSLDSVGQVTLKRGSTVRLGIRLSDTGLNPAHATLIITLMRGEISVETDQNAHAYIEAVGSVLTTSSGASLCVGVRDGQAVVEAIDGAVRNETQGAKPKYKIVPVKLDAAGRYKGPSSSTFKAEANKITPLNLRAVQELRGTTPRTKSNILLAGFMPPALPATDQDQAVSDLDIRFCVDNPAIGGFGPNRTACESARTNSEGIARVDYYAGPNPGSSGVTATIIQSPDVSWVGRIEVVKVAGFFSVRNVVVIGAAHAAAAIIIVKKETRVIIVRRETRIIVTPGTGQARPVNLRQR